MEFRMKTTLVIDDTVMQRVREEAARTHRTISELVESALRGMLEAKPIEAKALKPLPMLQGGPFLVDIANRDALYTAMDDE